MGWPSSRTSPESCGWAPVSTFTSVDLPAPLPPIRAWISPARREKSTPTSARTPGKLFEIRRASRIGVDSAMTPLPWLVLAAGEDLGGLLGREGLVHLLHPLRHGLALDGLVDGVEGQGPEERVALDRGVQLARHHGLEGALHAVDGDEQ